MMRFKRLWHDARDDVGRLEAELAARLEVLLELAGEVVSRRVADRLAHPEDLRIPGGVEGVLTDEGRVDEGRLYRLVDDLIRRRPELARRPRKDGVTG